MARAQTADHRPGRVLYIGAAYYNTWYLSRELRGLGWQADTVCSIGEGAQQFLHGTDWYLERYVHASGPIDPMLIEYFRGVSDRYLRDLSLPEATTSWFSGAAQRRLIRRACSMMRRDPLAAGRESDLIIDVTDALLHAARPSTIAGLYRVLIRLLRPHLEELRPLYDVIDRCDIIHFTGVNNLRLLHFINPALMGGMPIGWDIALLKRLGKKILYTLIGCLDGVAQSSFARWSDPSICSICKWRDVPSVCSDERNLQWGRLRNHLADYVISLGGNRVDYNDAPHVHEVPQFYCLDPDVWRPDLEVPPAHRLALPKDSVGIFHAVGNFAMRSDSLTQVNIKTTHVIVPTVNRLKAEGFPVELIFCTDVPSSEVRFYQAQADIVVDMLTYGFFGANIREAMMLGKTAVRYLRPEWLEQMRAEIPEYVDELPVVSATPETVYQVLAELVRDPDRRAELGRRGRAFMLKWHSRQAAGRRMAGIYSSLLNARSTQPPPARVVELDRQRAPWDGTAAARYNRPLPQSAGEAR